MVKLLDSCWHQNDTEEGKWKETRGRVHCQKPKKKQEGMEIKLWEDRTCSVEMLDFMSEEDEEIIYLHIALKYITTEMRWV